MPPRHTSPTGNGAAHGSSVMRYKDYYFPDGDVTFRVCNFCCTLPFLDLMVLFPGRKRLIPDSQILLSPRISILSIDVQNIGSVQRSSGFL
jgi:hypothetical protein